MKTTLLVLVFFAYSTLEPLYSQSKVKLTESTIIFEETQHICLKVNLDPESKTLKKAWKNYIKDNYDVRLKGIGIFSNKDLLSAEKVIISQISLNTIDFYTHIKEDENGSEMKIFARMGYDIFITKDNYPTEYESMKGIVESFIKYYLPKYYKNGIDDTEDRISELRKEVDDLNKEIETKSKKIQKIENEVTQKQEALLLTKTQLKKTEEKLSTREKKLIKIRSQLQKM